MFFDVGVWLKYERPQLRNPIALNVNVRTATVAADNGLCGKVAKPRGCCYGAKQQVEGTVFVVGLLKGECAAGEERTKRRPQKRDDSPSRFVGARLTEPNDRSNTFNEIALYKGRR